MIYHHQIPLKYLSKPSIIKLNHHEIGENPGKSRFEIPFSNLTILHFPAFLAGVWASSSSSRVALAKTASSSSAHGRLEAGTGWRWLDCFHGGTGKMAVCQNLVPLVNIKIAGKWMFIPLKMVLIN